MRSPGGGPILRGVGGVVEEGNMGLTRCVDGLRLVYAFCFDLVYVLGRKTKDYTRGRKTRKE